MDGGGTGDVGAMTLSTRRVDRAHQSRAALELGAEASGEAPANRMRRPGGRRCDSEAATDASGTATARQVGWHGGESSANRVRIRRGGKRRSPGKLDAEARAGAGRRRGRCKGDW